MRAWVLYVVGGRKECHIFYCRYLVGSCTIAVSSSLLLLNIIIITIVLFRYVYMYTCVLKGSSEKLFDKK